MKNPTAKERSWSDVFRRRILGDKRPTEAERVAVEFGQDLVATSRPLRIIGKPATTGASRAGPDSFSDDVTDPADRELLFKAWAALSRIPAFREIMSVNGNGHKVYEDERVVQLVCQLNLTFGSAQFCNMPAPLSMVQILAELRKSLGEHRVKDVVVREMSSCYWSKSQIEGKVLDPFGLHACLVVVLYRSNVKAADMK